MKTNQHYVLYKVCYSYSKRDISSRIALADVDWQCGIIEHGSNGQTTVTSDVFVRKKRKKEHQHQGLSKIRKEII
jgi:hypothetical protein